MNPEDELLAHISQVAGTESEHQLVEITFLTVTSPRSVCRPPTDDMLTLDYLAVAGGDRLSPPTRGVSPLSRSPILPN
jgi:hypothetical protein